MMQTIKLLIIEDSNSEITNYEDCLDIFNQRSSEYNIEYKICNNIEDGIEEIKSLNYNWAQIDLRLDNTDMEGKGNQALDVIINQIRMPVVIISGYLEDLDEEYKSLNNPLVMKYDRGEVEYTEIIDKIISIDKIGLTRMLGQNGLVEKYITEIFWTHLSKDTDYWLENINNIEKFDNVLLRYLITYLKEYLDINDDGEFEIYDKTEMYIIPPINNKVCTGDIILNLEDDKRYIILTPACDLANGKARSIVICEIDRLTNDPINQNKRKTINGNESERNEAANTIRRIISNSYSYKYHFLPPITSFEGGLINFQKLNTIPIKDAEDVALYKTVATISSNFIKDIIARFSNYYSRQGQPNINIDDIYKEIIQS